jgi:hypothetical protein
MDQNNQNLSNQPANSSSQVPTPSVPELKPTEQQPAGGLNEFTPEEQPSAEVVAPVVPAEEPTVKIEEPAVPAEEPAVVTEAPAPVPVVPPPADTTEASPLINNNDLINLSKSADEAPKVQEMPQSPSFEQASSPATPNIEQIDAELNNSSAFALPKSDDPAVSPQSENNQPVSPVAEGESNAEGEKPKRLVWPWVVSIISVIALIIAALIYYMEITISF